MTEPTATILVIDDDAILRRGLAIYLSDSGYRTLEAPNGQAGLDICRAECPDLVLCDLRMPGLDGLDVLSSLTKSHPDLPVIILTGQGVLQDAIGALRRGAWDFLTKPILDYDMLEIAVLRALDRSRLTQENRRYREHLEEEVQRKTEEYRASESRLKATIESLHEAFVLVFDKEGAILQALGMRELEQRHGVSMDDIKDGAFVRTFSSEAIAWHHKAVRRVISKGAAVTGVTQVRFPKGMSWLECTYSPMYGQDGSVEHVLGFARDITGRKAAEREAARLEAQLRQSQKMEALGALAGGIAHDFNNMLSVILGFCDLALNENASRSPAAALREIQTAGRRAADLVRQILTFSRGSDVERAPLELAPVAKEALRLLRSSLPTNIELVQDVGKVGCVLGDPGQIHQIILNLGSNAYHAMRHQETGRVSVLLEVADAETLARQGVPAGDYIRLRVEDTGAGIPPEVMEHIFEPFYTTKAEGEGTGMGLAILHGIVSQYGGFARAESQPGEGSAFDIFLPRITEPVPRQRPAATELLRGTGRVLVVDDEPACMLLGQQLLEDFGYTVTACTSSMEALGHFRAAPESFDLVMTDQVMPDLSGLGLARAIQALRPGVPVLLVSAAADMPEGSEALAVAGVREHLLKPVEAPALAKAVWRVMNRQPAEAEPARR